LVYGISDATVNTAPLEIHRNPIKYNLFLDGADPFRIPETYFLATAVRFDLSVLLEALFKLVLVVLKLAIF
ncbi:hypothetical protein, partial [Brucella intermedia]|uniref:hypothetical protein n=1 Tax=Brucella intermedia TaxID=94625 RepID=UPI002360A3B6